MKLNEIEPFIRAAAAHNWSHRQTRKALDVSEVRFSLMMKALPDVQWAPTGKKARQLATYQSCPKWAEGRARGLAAIRASLTHTVGDRTGTITQLARQVGLSPSTVHRRLAKMSLAEALALPPQRRNKPEARHAAQH